ncbi:MAG TPA: uroporphyrinogen decarboxylase family protein [Oscillospiraceae bacterium]|nr:uroporphyrinogen decarboxylase family protein [Oscillospiraceae bacterium]HPF56284.1 uroporphyrinogen decarboxylase family protein [Clostridiales bacterium]HPK35742.1 uroporphyrinogen decarboxylase family protein [Oscillospiraceae bacterium]HPR75050.1 uroporphyrinogen decarboxylase family protein [Oscillospiraceae bacterium]
MTGRERVYGALRHEPIDRVPRYDSFWDETLMNWGISAKELAQRFDFDIRVFGLDNSMRFSTSREDLGEQEIVNDRCGYRVRRFKKGGPMDFLWHATAEYEGWSQNKHRFRLDPADESRVDVAAFFLRTTPVPDWDTAIAAINADSPDKFRLMNFYGPCEATWRHHGFENWLMDMAAEPEWTMEMFGAVTNLTIETLDYALQKGLKFDGIWMTEDLGSTRATLMSPKTYRELIFPWHKKLGDYVKSKNLKFFMHSCGDVSDLIPDFIEAGVDVLQPLQANTTMHVVRLKEQYGDRISFWGNISVAVMEQGKEAILEEAKSKLIPAKRGGGYLYHSDHSIPADVTYENYAYLMGLLDEYGTY